MKILTCELKRNTQQTLQDAQRKLQKPVLFQQLSLQRIHMGKMLRVHLIEFWESIVPQLLEHGVDVSRNRATWKIHYRTHWDDVLSTLLRPPIVGLYEPSGKWYTLTEHNYVAALQNRSENAVPVIMVREGSKYENHLLQSDT